MIQVEVDPSLSLKELCIQAGQWTQMVNADRGREGCFLSSSRNYRKELKKEYLHADSISDHNSVHFTDTASHADSK